MVRGGISLEGYTDLYVLNRGNLISERYRDEILLLGPILVQPILFFSWYMTMSDPMMQGCASDF